MLGARAADCGAGAAGAASSWTAQADAHWQQPQQERRPRCEACAVSWKPSQAIAAMANIREAVRNMMELLQYREARVVSALEMNIHALR